MNSSRLVVALVLGAIGCGPLPAATIATPLQRQASVVVADRLTKAPTEVPAPGDLKSPFSPPDFDKPVAGEGRKPDAPRNSGDKKGGPATPDKPAGPASDRETIEALATRVPNAATIDLGGKIRLVLGTTRLVVGDVFTVNDPVSKNDYELELVAITSTTFTLRYRGEEVTRPLRNAK